MKMIQRLNNMNLEQRIEELEKRIALLESQRPIINVYPYQQPVQTYHPYYNPTTGGGNITLTPSSHPFHNNC